MATKRSESFPLNFDEASWTIEIAVPLIFFGDFDEPERQRLSQSAIQFLVNEVGTTVFKTQYPPLNLIAEELHKELIALRKRGAIADRTEGYAPLVWCRLAVQLWLEYGIRQKSFMNPMLHWIKTKCKDGPPLVKCNLDRNGIRKTQKIPLTVFLFEDINEANRAPKNPILTISKQHAIVRPLKSTNKSNTKISTSIGKNALDLVLNLVSTTAKKGEIKNLKARFDPIHNRFQYIGLRSDLYHDLNNLYPEKMGRYKKSVLIKAISQAAICRKYFAKK